MKRPPLLLLYICVLWLWAGQAFAYYVIPYTVYIGTEKYTALVVLADHFDHFFGEQDGLSAMLAQNFHADPETFVSPYLQVPYQWYLDQLRLHPEIYGKDAGAIAAGLKQFEEMKLGKTSAVIITEYQRLERVITFLRADTEGEDGLLTSERDFIHKGLISPFPKPEPEFKWRRVPNFQQESYLQGLHSLNAPSEDRMHLWLEGENIELKNFGITPDLFRKFFPALYRIGRAHKIIHWGSQLFPEEKTHWPDGARISREATERYGRRVSHVWIDAYTDELRNFYAKMGFRIWDKINNEHTQFKNLYFMVAEVARLDGALSYYARRSNFQLVMDRSLSDTLKKGLCGRVSSAAGLAF